MKEINVPHKNTEVWETDVLIALQSSFKEIVVHKFLMIPIVI